MEYKKSHCEFLRLQSKQKFEKVKNTWIDAGRWALPHRIDWLIQRTPGERNNQHIVDDTHILALRSYVAGFLEGNTSATRPWYRSASNDPHQNESPENKAWLEQFTKRQLSILSSSNFYHSAGQFYYDYGVFNSAAYYIDEVKTGLFFHNLIPGSYYVINNAFGEAITLVREFSMSVKALVDYYGRKKNGMPDWSNFSDRVKKCYDDANYTQMIDCVHVVYQNSFFDAEKPQGGANRQWVSMAYELGGSGGQYYQDGQEYGLTPVDSEEDRKFLNMTFSRRKPFLVGVSDRNGNFEWGQRGPTTDALGLIKSLNKKAISKDMALELMIKPPTQGPASLRRSYITTQSNSYVPLDGVSDKRGGLRPIFEVNPAIGSLYEDVQDLRTQVDKLYYADYLLYLSRNPKTRTATETNAVIQEQQLIIGPNLQSLNWTHNVPLVEFVMDYVLDMDPYLDEMPQGLAGKFVKPDFISVFAQAQKAADLPSIDRFMGMVENVGQLNPKIWDSVNIDKLAQLYEDRLYLPVGLVNPQSKIDAQREQALAAQQRQMAMQETIPAMAGAAKDLGIKVQQ